MRSQKEIRQALDSLEATLRFNEGSFMGMVISPGRVYNADDELILKNQIGLLRWVLQDNES